MAKQKSNEEQPVDNELLRDIVFNEMLSRQEWVRNWMDPRRNINDECGYPDTSKLDVKDYRDLYDREAVARRVVHVLPDECWQVVPNVYETEDVNETTEFERTFEEFCKGLRRKSHYKKNEGNPLWSYLHRLDVLSGIGTFGVLLIGFDDVTEDRTLADPVENPTKVLFLRVFDESVASVVAYDTDKFSDRYGMPTKYQVTINNPDESQKSSIGQTTQTIDVHWTRIIHVADNLVSNELFGAPRLLPVYNRVYDLRKLYSGSAEMYWRGAFPGLTFETHPQLGPNVKIDAAALRDQAEKYMNTLQRYLVTSGMGVKSLAPQVVDPAKQIDVQLEAICIEIAVPKRIFLGSERGELSSTQDKGSWNDRLMHRQSFHVTPNLIVPLMDRLIEYDILAEPGDDGYTASWPDLNTTDEETKAKVGLTRTQALVQYIQGDGEILVSPTDFNVHYLGFDDDLSQQMIEQAQETYGDNPQREAETTEAETQQPFNEVGPNENDNTTA